jgi:Chlorophyll A-B binding protein
MREAELKHCRLAMLAVTGALAQELGVVFPGLPAGKNQIENFWQVVDTNPGPLVAGFLFIGIVELISAIAVTEGRKSGELRCQYNGHSRRYSSHT